MATPSSPRGYVYFLDGSPTNSQVGSIRGLDIRNQLPEAKRDYGIFEEAAGDAEDVQIQDPDTIDLGRSLNPRRFYSVPPATFGV